MAVTPKKTTQTEKVVSVNASLAQEAFVDLCAIHLFARGRPLKDCFAQSERLWNQRQLHYANKNTVGKTDTES